MNPNRKLIKLMLNVILGMKVATLIILLLTLVSFAYNVATVKAAVETVTQVTGRAVEFEGTNWVVKETTHEFAVNQQLQFHCWTWSSAESASRNDPVDHVIVKTGDGKYWYLPKTAVTKAFYTRNGEKIG